MLLEMPEVTELTAWPIADVFTALATADGAPEALSAEAVAMAPNGPALIA